MIYMYFEIRYKKQLVKIARPFIDEITERIFQTIKSNGGVILRNKTAYFSAFDETSIGGICAISFCISDILHICSEGGKKLGEYTFYIDQSGQNDEDVFETMQNKAIRMLNDCGAFCSQSVQNLLRTYFTFSSEKEGMIKDSILDPIIHSSNNEKNASEIAFPLLCTMQNENSSSIKSLRNVVALFPMKKIVSCATDEQKHELERLVYSLRAYESNRFVMQEHDDITQIICEYVYLCCVLVRTYYRITNKRFYFYGDTSSEHPLYLRLLSAGFNIQQADLVRAEADTASIQDINKIPSDILEIAYLFFRSEDFLFSDELVSFFQFIGKDEDFIVHVYDFLQIYGLIEYRGEKPFISATWRSLVAAKISNCKEKLDGILGSYMWEKYLSGELKASIELYTILSSLHVHLPDDFILSALYLFLERQDVLCDSGLLSDVLLYKIRLPFESAQKLKRIVDIRQSAAKDSRFFHIDEYYTEAEKGDSLFDTALLLECAKWYYYTNQFARASMITKKALERFQKKRNKDGEFRCFSLLALLNLAQGITVDAETYFEYAYEGAEFCGDELSVLKTHFDLAVVSFIEGNYSRCIHTLSHMQKSSAELFISDWQLCILFLLGRCYLDLGKYKNAEESFAAAGAIANRLKKTDAYAVCRIWYARTISYTGQYSTAEQVLAPYVSDFPDASLFMLECAVMRGALSLKRHTKETDDLFSASFMERAVKLYAHRAIWFSEYGPWTSGFAFCEDRVFINKGDNSIGIHLLHCFFAVYNGDADTLQQLSRDEASSVSDPYNYLYPFLLFVAHEARGGIAELDQVTVLSKSFKLLQKRANHIDEINVRADFLKKSYWTSRLYTEAQQRMLI